MSLNGDKDQMVDEDDDDGISEVTSDVQFVDDISSRSRTRKSEGNSMVECSDCGYGKTTYG